MRRKNMWFVLGILAFSVAAVAVVRVLNPDSISSTAERQADKDKTFAQQVVTSGCQADRPAFYYGFADLHGRLGGAMGAAIECEHAIHENGDTRQQTTTGYAYYRKSDNIPTFTNGWDHWALTSDGLVYWSGDVVDPPTTRAATGTR